jgi:Tfp pilus assembly protein PilF
VRTGGARANLLQTSFLRLCALSADKTDQVRRVYSHPLLFLLIFFLSVLPHVLAQTSPDPSTPGPRYAISVQQMQVPAKVRAYIAKARQEFGRLDFPAASREVERALQMDSDCAEAFTMRAFIELAKNDFEGAFADATHATTLDPNDALSFLTLATAENSRRNFKPAAVAAQQAVRTQPDLWQAHLELAKAFSGQGQTFAALRELDSLKVDFPDAHLVRGNVLMQLGRNQEASREFATFLEEAPRDKRRKQINEIVANLNTR